MNDVIKGSREAIFRVTDEINPMQGGVLLCSTSQREAWDYIQWMVVWELTSHHDEKCETILNEWWCESWHHITMRSVRLYSMDGAVWAYTLVADRIVTAAWLLSFCVARCVERFGFATWCCKTHCNGCMDVAWASFWEKAGASGFGAAISSAFARSSSVFCDSVSADRIVMAASRLLGATAACVILLSFAAGHRKLYWSGCIEAAIVS